MKLFLSRANAFNIPCAADSLDYLGQDNKPILDNVNTKVVMHLYMIWYLYMISILELSLILPDLHQVRRKPLRSSHYLC